MSAPSTEEAAVLASLDNQGPALLAQVEGWSAINSGSRNLEGLAHMAKVLGEAFGPLGGNLSLRDPAVATAVDAQGRETPLLHGRNLHLIQRPEAPIRVLLTGHMDTVFAADHPFQAVHRLDDNTVNGPGMADMKGGIAVMLAALRAVEASPFAAALGYEVVLNSDEEVSSPGSAPLLVEAARRVQAGLTYEPSMPDGALAGARKGSGNFSAVIKGRAAHAGRNPQDGRNAIVAAGDLALGVAAFAKRRPTLSANPARIDGGGPNNIVPDLAILRFNLRPTTVEDQRWAEAAMAEVIAAVAAEHEVEITLKGGFGRPPKPLDANQRRLFDLVKACGADLGLDIGWRDTGGVCDGNNLAACGLPVVDTLGVRGGAIHSDEEYLLVDSLVERARLSALLLMRLAQGALPAAIAASAGANA
ncbi:hydrolase [Caulobacter sp. S45]|uniref:hydrolase n=1 Tax=Caulobacter sp. S45 TaxID=1641861 RepID=UPI00131E2C45|nr:hydrolase [Caulobacter sp. S45]